MLRNSRENRRLWTQLSSSWGNGHATLWRGLITALASRGHEVVFFERDVPYYAAHRDFAAFPGAQLVLYSDWKAISSAARRHVAVADATIVTSYCPDANAAANLCCEAAAAAVNVFYDLDTPVTLARLNAGEPVDYLPAAGLGAFDLVLSFTGGPALTAMRELLGARRVVPLYGHVDPMSHRPVPCEPGVPARICLIWAPTLRIARPSWRSCSSGLPGAVRSGASCWAAPVIRTTSPGPGICSSCGTCPRAAPHVFLFIPAHTQCDAGGHGLPGILPFRPSVRGCRLWYGIVERLLGGIGAVLSAWGRDSRRE